MKKTELLFLGTDACIPEPGNDTASYLIDDELLVDGGLARDRESLPEWP